jgi:16S rRNA (guanine1207-N2)-methyltransferase
MNPTSELFVRTAQLEPGQHVLLLHSGDPALAQWVLEQVGPAGRVTALHSSHSALTRLASVEGLMLSETVYPVAETHGPAHVVLLNIPKGRSVVRALLWTAAQALQPGGRLYLAGPNARGAKSAIKDAAHLLGDAPVLDYRRSRRIALAIRPESLHLPAAWAGERPWSPQFRGMQRSGRQVMIMTMPGVFAWDRLDEGTALLLDHVDVRAGTEVLDIGCGYGIIGVEAARQGAHVVMVDDDLRAVRCARGSVLANDLGTRCDVLPSDVTSAVRDRRFDLVLSNPPFHKGVENDTSVAERIIRESADVLRPGGRLRIVANRFLPYDHLMRATFGGVMVVAETGRYYVLESVRA